VANLDEPGAVAARLRASADAERRAIERNLHDGVQQDLAALDVNLQLVQALAETDVAAAKALLQEMRQHVQETLECVRELAATIYPPALPLRGLANALRWIPARVEAADLARYPLEVEEAVYFCCVELLRNAGPDAAVHISEDAETLCFSITGAELEDASVNVVRDRLTALGGALTASGGTTRGVIPL
jgi:hypothetical protein